MRLFRIASLILLFGLSACAREAPQCPTTTAAASPTDANKALVARFVDELWNRKKLDAISIYVAPDLVNHAAIPEAQGATGLRTIASKLQTAFPDLTMTVTGISADADDVVVRVVFEGTQMGELDFKQPIPATQKHVKVDQVHTFRVRNGKIVESWMVMDRLALMTQLGVLPK
jgi:predicted ester cyclase